jgi:hypothetical protein
MLRCAQHGVAKYHQALRHYHQHFVRKKAFQVGDCVLRCVLNREGMNKLSPNWEAPFMVTEVCHPSCFKLATEDDIPLPNPWNIEHLHKFYP